MKTTLDEILKKLGIERKISKLFDDLSIDASFILSKMIDPAKESEKLKVTSPLIFGQLTRLFESYKRNLEQIIRSALQESYEAAEKKNDSILMKILKGYGIALAGSKLLKIFNRVSDDPSTVNMDNVLTLQRNVEAFASFLKNDLDLSPRVWNLMVEQNRELIQQYLASGLSKGQSAARIANDLKQYLKDPDKRFRRLRDKETGKLKLSAPAKNYHPGQGVYRSSYQNALRLSRNEINMAYRRADLFRWRQIDFVIGYEVTRSAAHVVDDMCDYLYGSYPKTFTFTGWHPVCKCIATPIMLSQDQFVKYLNTDTIPKDLKITGVPPRTFNWVKENSKSISRLKSKPYFIKDNFTQRKGVFYPNKNISFHLNKKPNDKNKI